MKKLPSAIIMCMLVTAVMLPGCSNANNITSTSETKVTVSESTTEVQTTVAPTTEEETTHADTVDGYKFAEYKTYNSPAEENGLGGEKVYFDGTVTKIDTAAGFIYGIVQADGGEWLVLIASTQIEDKSTISSLYLTKPIRVFGTYHGFSEVEKKPALLAEKITCEGKTLPYNQLSDFMDLDSQPKTESPTTKPESKETVIFNNLGVKITCKGVEYGSYRNSVNLRIENNSGHDYEFQVRDTSVNGYMIDPIFSCKVKNGKVANDELTFYQNDLDKNGIKKFETIELSIHAFNWDDNSNDFDSEMITFNP